VSVFFSFQCQVRKKVLFDFQKLTSAEEQEDAWHPIRTHATW